MIGSRRCACSLIGGQLGRFCHPGGFAGWAELPNVCRAAGFSAACSRWHITCCFKFRRTSQAFPDASAGWGTRDEKSESQARSRWCETQITSPAFSITTLVSAQSGAFQAMETAEFGHSSDDVLLPGVENSNCGSLYPSSLVFFFRLGGAVLFDVTDPCDLSSNSSPLNVVPR